MTVRRERGMRWRTQPRDADRAWRGATISITCSFISWCIYVSHFLRKMSGPSTSYTLSATAYAIPILHAAQHPSSTTTGLLLGPSSSSSTSTPQVSITDAIPLQHVNTSLSPYTELGLEMVDKYAESKGMRVVGLYVARESGEGLGRTGERLLAKLKESFSDAFALEVGAPLLDSGCAVRLIE